MKKTKTKKAGFSLLELSIAATIIAVLISAIAAGGQMVQKARMAGAQALTKSSPVNRISNLLVWYETTSSSSFKSTEVEAASIATWYNLSPYALSSSPNNATAGSNPTYTENAINGLPSLRFNGSSNYFTYDGTSLANNNYTIFIVQQRRASQSNVYLLAGTTSSTNQNLHVGYSANTTAIFNQYSNDLSVTVSGYNSPIPEIDTYWFSSATGKNYYVNGTALITSTTANAKTALTSYAGASIGGRSSGNYISADISEIIIFNKALNKDEQNDVQQYLGKKWKITVATS